MGTVLKAWCDCGTACFAAVLVLVASAHAQTGSLRPSLNQRDVLLEYERLIKSGVQSNAQGDYAAAGRAYRRAATICLSHFGEEDPVCGNALIRLGLELSNQGRFDTADDVFRVANALAQRATSPFDLPRYLIYRAMDMSNREKFVRARDLILSANKRYSVLISSEIAAVRTGNQAARQRLASILREFAHGLFVHAGIARRLGQVNEAKLSVRLAKDITGKIGGASNDLLDSLEGALRKSQQRQQQVKRPPADEAAPN